MKKLGVIRLFICLAAIITELLPLGAVLKYGLMSDNGHLIFRFENYSYFDVTPFGYAMFLSIRALSALQPILPAPPQAMRILSR